MYIYVRINKFSAECEVVNCFACHEIIFEYTHETILRENLIIYLKANCEMLTSLTLYALCNKKDI